VIQTLTSVSFVEHFLNACGWIEAFASYNSLPLSFFASRPSASAYTLLPRFVMMLGSISARQAMQQNIANTFSFLQELRQTTRDVQKKKTIEQIGLQWDSTQSRRVFFFGWSQM
jgi:hypothetical protein